MKTHPLKTDKSPKLWQLAGLSGLVQPDAAAEGKGLEPTTGKPAPDFESVGTVDKARENGNFSACAAQGAARDMLTPLDPSLAIVVSSWSSLPNAIKTAVVAVVRSVTANELGENE